MRMGAMRLTVIYFRPARKKYFVEMRERQKTLFALFLGALAHSLVGANDTYFDYII